VVRTVETEKITEEERDLKSTDRFELQNEAQNIIRMEGDLKSGSSISPSYGPVVEFQNNNESPIQGSITQSTTQATTFAKDVTTRASSKVAEMVQVTTTTRLMKKFEEKAEHAFDNTKVDARQVHKVS